MSVDGFAPFSDAPTPEELSRFDSNDFGNGQRLIRLAGGKWDEAGALDISAARLLYLADAGWIGFNGKYWDLRHGARMAERMAHEVAKGLYAQAEFIDAGPPKKLFLDFAKQSGNAGRTSAMMTQARSYLEVELEAFDCHPLRLNCRNGTLTFSREAQDGMGVKFTAHDPADRITRMAEVTYDAKAAAPVFERSFADWLSDEEVRRFVQTLLGYCITGKTSEQVFILFQGKGRDGKSTLVRVFRVLMGGYCATADVKTFLEGGMRSGADASPDLARLSGDVRVVSSSEPPRNAKLAEGMIKAFTGGAPITARRLKQDIFEFTPKAKPLIECNGRPTISGADDGIWRRVVPILFENQVPEDQVDKELADKIIEAELSGVLNWLIAGLHVWMIEGLKRPRRVMEALEDYRRGSSTFAEWLNDRVVIDPEAKTPATFFYTDYKRWMEDQGHDRPMSQTTFGRALSDLQILRAGKDAGGRVQRRGAKLKDDYLPPAGAPDASEAGHGPGGQRGQSPFDDGGF